MNRLHPNLHTGTLGELLVQLRLLQYDVQAVATHKDTGNALTGRDANAAVRKGGKQPPRRLHRAVELISRVLCEESVKRAKNAR